MTEIQRRPTPTVRAERTVSSEGDDAEQSTASGFTIEYVEQVIRAGLLAKAKRPVPGGAADDSGSAPD